MTLADIRWDVILGGFGLFMFGIEFMGSSLKEFAGPKLKEYIDKFTSNPFSAFLIGVVITVIMQSSSASTAITIGMVRAGLMSLEQAAGIVFGANIGTTITSFLISLDLGQYILYVIFAGAIVSCFSNNKKTKCLGNIFLGFGLVFYGLNSMGDALSVLKEIPAFTIVAEKLSNNALLSLFAGTIMTGLCQASAATIGVVQKMYEAGALSFTAVLPFVFGANIGTTVTGILASIGGSTAAKRTAGIHTMFNIVGSCIGLLLLKPMSSVILSVSSALHMNPMMQVALAHICFNTLATIVCFPFLKQICKVLCVIIKGKPEKRLTADTDKLDLSLAKNLPSAALGASKEVILSMAKAVKENVERTKEYVMDRKEETLDWIDQGEEVINTYDSKLTNYLIATGDIGTMGNQDIHEQRKQLEVIKNYERVGDLATNLKEFFQMIEEDKHDISREAKEEVLRMYAQLESMLDCCTQYFEYGREEDYAMLCQLEEGMDAMAQNSRFAHFERMEKGKCKAQVAESVYCDILENLERMGDHCFNVGTKTHQSLE